MVITKKLLFILVAIVVVLAGLILILTGVATPSRYSLVVLSDGEVFVGRLERFPSLRLVDPWFPQRGQDQQTVNLVPWQNSLWGPENVIYLNEDEIVYTSPISLRSQVFQVVNNPNIPLPQLPAPQTGTGAQ